MIKDFKNINKPVINTLMNSEEKSNEEYQTLLKSMIKLNEELTRKKLLLENSSAIIEKALYKMTHDLYSPLSNVEGLVNILKINGCYEDVNNKPIIDMIIDAVLKFKTRIKDVANFNSLMAAHSTNEWRQLKDVLEAIKSKFDASITSANATIEASFVQENNSLCNESNYCILHNLLLHALNNKSDASNPKIFFKSYVKDEFEVIEMEEDNRVVSEEFLSAIEHSDTSDINEMVNGLYIVRKIAEEAGGGMKLETLSNKKVVYRVFFKKN